MGALLVLFVYVPALSRPFGLAPLALAHWLLLATFPILVVGLEELRKIATRRARAARGGARGSIS